MSTAFQQELDAWPAERVRELVAQAGPGEVDRALAAEDRSLADLAALLSPAARPRLEAAAREAQRLTRWHFGRTISLYAPIYVSNVCGADCLYCGFATHSGETRERLTLSVEEIRKECEALAARGFQSVLYVSGDAPAAVSLDYLAEAVAIGREYFPSVCVEVYGLDQEDYARLHRCGLEGVTLYMETFDPSTYARMHRKGSKRDYDYRLTRLERAGKAGIRKLSTGVLLGLFDWRVDAFWTALHVRHLQKVCWRSAISVSFPRLRHVPSRFEIPCRVDDADLVQIMLAMRLFLPEAGFNLSTRESPAFRDHLIPLGVTSMSAGSSTAPGGYVTHGDEALEQFAIDDDRPTEKVEQAIRDAGYDPVWKDYDLAFDDVNSSSRKGKQ